MDIVRGGAFGVAITLTKVLTQRFCPNASFESVPVPLQPPGGIFVVMWPILFVTTGASWVLADHTVVSDVMYASLTLLCCTWLPLYTWFRYYRVSTAVLFTSVVAAASTIVIGTNDWKWLSLPLVVWLCFATYLNAYRTFVS